MSPSVSIAATSTPSCEVPLVSPIAGIRPAPAMISATIVQHGAVPQG
jgi:hypothetical protein